MSVARGSPPPSPPQTRRRASRADVGDNPLRIAVLGDGDNADAMSTIVDALFKQVQDSWSPAGRVFTGIDITHSSRHDSTAVFDVGVAFVDVGDDPTTIDSTGIGRLASFSSALARAAERAVPLLVVLTSHDPVDTTLDDGLDTFLRKHCFVFDFLRVARSLRLSERLAPRLAFRVARCLALSGLQQAS